ANNGLTAGHTFTIFGNGGDGSSDYLISEDLLPYFGLRDHLAGGGGVTLAAHGDLVVDLDLQGVTASTLPLNLLATGDLLLRRQVQNSGSGAVSLVAGWDGSTGMSPGWLDFL